MGSAGHQLGEGAFSRAIAGPWRGGGWGGLRLLPASLLAPPLRACCLFPSAF